VNEVEGADGVVGHRTYGPDAYLDAVARQVRLTRIMEEPAVVTWWLLGANIVIWAGAVLYGWAVVTPTFDAASAPLNYEQLVLYSGMKVDRLMDAGQWWRLFSSQFVHLDILHLLFNGYGLYVVGPILERFYGRKRFAVLYLAAGTVGATASYWFTDMASGGASGALYGLIGALVVFGLEYRSSLPDRLSRAFTVGLVPWVVLSLAVGFLEAIPMDNAAHLGGLACGVILGLSMQSKVRQAASRLREWAVGVGAILGVCALVYTAAHWTEELTRCTQSREIYLQCYTELEHVLDEGLLEVPD